MEKSDPVTIDILNRVVGNEYTSTETRKKAEEKITELIAKL